ncbi:sarcosine oxidase subunit gamma [Roseibium sediminicola]|uniref:Sarcosine oxidase subunit gamma n=1 Tax=Roseibium sediminicola TaxID=2933272 RepID=A0ABT0GW49_9HYPH|nr:sarcosine oxidase subunit gamma family protein [Roseibium sp. CAU 1639]MCK7613667.1 sarcosine oxidase subunit gamma [Roseibium sp. CAU 1639]
MAELMSALKGHLTPGRYGLEGTAGVTLSEVHPFSLTQIAAWPDSLQAVGLEATLLAGCDAAPTPGQAALGPNGTLLRVEPLKWWLIGRDTPPDLPSLPAETGAVLDLSSSRTWIRLGGANAADLLNRFLPLNLSATAFPAGSSASTAFHHIGVTLWRDEDGFNLLLPRSFAASLWEMLTESAAQFGTEVV